MALSISNSINQRQIDQEGIGLVFYNDSSNISYTSQGISRHYTYSMNFKEGSLFKMCLQSLMMNIDLIDSLVGLPDIIGKEIFHHLIERHFFRFEQYPKKDPTSKDSERIKVLNIFVEAYGSIILSRASFENVRNSYKQLGDFISIFTPLTELSLMNVQCGNELLVNVSKLVNLEKLTLSNMGLTDENCCTLTGAYRMYKEKSRNLKILNLSRNRLITQTSIKHCFVFENLELLNLSDCNMRICSPQTKTLVLRKGFRVSNMVCSSSFDTSEIPTSCGWAVKVIDLALSTNANNCKHHTATINKSTKSFYAKRTKSHPRTEKESIQQMLTKKYFYLIRSSATSYNLQDAIILNQQKALKQISKIVSSRPKKRKNHCCSTSDEDDAAELIKSYKKAI